MKTATVHFGGIAHRPEKRQSANNQNDQSYEKEHENSLLLYETWRTKARKYSILLLAQACIVWNESCPSLYIELCKIRKEYMQYQDLPENRAESDKSIKQAGC
jgi:hypothetical protein